MLLSAPIQSKKLGEFIHRLSSATTKAEHKEIWEKVETPFIEDIAENPEYSLVTFVYRLKNVNITHPPLIYLYSAITGMTFAESALFHVVPDSEVRYLSLVLPKQLRTCYSFLKVDVADLPKVNGEPAQEATTRPVIMGNFKKAYLQLMYLFEQGRVEIDRHNRHRITYIKYENPEEAFGTESILELPDAPKQPLMSQSNKAIREAWDKLTNAKRFIEHTVAFANTALKNVEGYVDKIRKYWVYLPPNYQEDAAQPYPLLLFLDGSDYLSTIPVPAMLDKMIEKKLLPPVIAVFFDYTVEQRIVEYDCNDKFTQFLANDFMSILRKENQLNITHDEDLNTVIGMSASGLAAFYCGLSYPNIFGNVVAQSPSLEMKKPSDVQVMIHNYLKTESAVHFNLEVGMYETIPIELKFPDGTTQNLSSYQANKNMVDYMLSRDIKVTFREFFGGHNYICWRNSLPDMLREIYYHRHAVT